MIGITLQTVLEWSEQGGWGMRDMWRAWEKDSGEYNFFVEV